MRFRFALGHATIVLALACLALASPTARAADRAVDGFIPVVTRGDYLTFCQTVGLSQEQKLILDMMFSDYAAAIEELGRQTDAAVEKAGRSRVQEALTGRRRLGAEELVRLRADIARAEHAAYPELDALYDRLSLDLVSLLDDPTAPRVTAALRTMHCAVWTRGRARLASAPEYGGEGMDLVALWKTYRDRDDCTSVPADQIESILADYRAQVDAYLHEFARADRDDEAARHIAEITSEDAERQRMERRLVQRWDAWYDLHRRTIEAMVPVLTASVGEDVGRHWRDHCYDAMFPTIVSSRDAERMAVWVLENITDERCEEARTILASYRDRRSATADRIREVHIRARRELGRVLHAMVDPASLSDRRSREMYEEMLRLSGRQSTEDARMVDAIRALLTADEREAMSRAMRRSGRSGRGRN